MMGLRWIVQNLPHVDDVTRVTDACRALNIACSVVDIPPFTSGLPDVPADMPTLFWGSTGFVAHAVASRRWTPGAFYPSGAFHASVWTPMYRCSALNSDSRFMTLAEIQELDFPEEHCFFVRPDADTKEFGGVVMNLARLRRWLQRETTRIGARVSEDTRSALASEKPITREWRLFIVDGAIASASLYREYGTPREVSGAPEGVHDFATERMAEYRPAPCYVMDIAESDGQLFVLELNGLNSSGFFACDVQTIIRMTTEFTMRQQQ